MKELDIYYDALFKEARKLEFIRKLFLIGILISLSFAVYAKGYILYYAALSAVLLQFLVWYFGNRVNQSNSLAHEFQKLSMLEKAYGNVPSDFDLSHLKAKVSLSVSRKALKNIQEGYNPIEYNLNLEKKKSKERVLKSMLQENAYWNHHLYNYTFKRYLIILILLFSGVLLVPLFMIPLIKSDPDYSLPRLAFTILSLSIVFECLMTKNLQKQTEQTEEREWRFFGK